MKPINLHAHEVRAALAGNLGLIVRPVKPQPPSYINELHGNELAERAPYRIEHPESGQIIGIGFQDDNEVFYKSPFKPGDRLWGRETFRDHNPHLPENAITNRADHVLYRADDVAPHQIRRWQPSTHMPRWASRITLEITTLAVKQVAKITEAEAMACGFGSPVTRDCKKPNFLDWYQKQYGDTQWAWFCSVKGAE